jgi:NAD(P)-dependent dehydrogenase (short-subunit alcohol dehydrogenase family)
MSSDQKTVLITGAAGHLGGATAQALHAQGARLLMGRRTPTADDIQIDRKRMAGRTVA